MIACVCVRADFWRGLLVSTVYIVWLAPWCLAIKLATGELLALHFTRLFVYNTPAVSLFFIFYISVNFATKSFHSIFARCNVN